ncbi:MAG TPA: FG-GAP-like repeat-containing protein [Ardenticatenaceae bacterium]|nr:FG-GAP-like repeat-containing protein [Ardenticatenaceae bacterium]
MLPRSLLVVIVLWLALVALSSLTPTIPPDAALAATDPDLEPGFPVQTSPSGDMYHAGQGLHTLVGNIDTDPMLEIVVPAYGGGALHGWNPDGSVLSGWPITGSLAGGYSAMGDLSVEAPGLELFSASTTEWLHAYDGSGRELPGWPRKSALSPRTAGSLADVDGDGLDEIFVGENDYFLHAYKADGSVLPGWPVELYVSQERHTPAIADLDGDGDLEIVGTSGSPAVQLLAYHHDGTFVDGFPLAVHHGVYTFPVIGDVDGDGQLEIVAVGDRWVQIISARGEIERSIYMPEPTYWGTAPALADLDGDFIPEIIVQLDSTLNVWRGDGAVFPGWPVAIKGKGNSAPVAGDVDGDQQPDIVILTEGGVRVYSHNGILHPRFPKTLPLGEGAVPAIADIDLDGRNEIIVTGELDGDKVWVYDLGGPEHGRIEWGQFRANERHHGLYVPAAPPGGPLPTATPVPGDDNWDSRFDEQGMNWHVYALLDDQDGNVYAGGLFTEAGGVPVNKVARWNGRRWHPVGDNLSIQDSRVEALTLDVDDTLYVGGVFAIQSERGGYHVGKWNGSAWEGLSGGSPDPAGAVDVLLADGQTIYIGGAFRTVDGVGVGNLVAWDGDRYDYIEAASWVHDLALDGDDLYVAMRSGVRKWNRTTRTWSHLGSGVNGPVYAVAVDRNGILYAGGSFTQAGGVVANNVARWDGNAWAPLGTGASAAVLALAVDEDGTLYAGGDFTGAGGAPANRIARWDGTKWAPLGSGVDERVNAILVDAEGLYVGGWFKTAGGKPSRHIARWHEPATTPPSTTPTASPTPASQRTPTSTRTPTPPATGSTTVRVRVAEGVDDAEERAGDGAMTLHSGDLELVDDSGYNGAQTVGLRFRSVAVPRGATITRAFIEFESDEIDSGATSLLFYGEASDRPAAFSYGSEDISSRSRTTASVRWEDVPAWTAVGSRQRTIDLSPIVQEIVNRSGWASGNPLAFIVTGSGERTAKAYETAAEAAPLLHIEYTTGPRATATGTGVPTATSGPGLTPTVTPTGSATTGVPTSTATGTSPATGTSTVTPMGTGTSLPTPTGTPTRGVPTSTATGTPGGTPGVDSRLYMPLILRRR